MWAWSAFLAEERIANLRAEAERRRLVRGAARRGRQNGNNTEAVIDLRELPLRRSLRGDRELRNSETAAS
jgi:hypothetical protein